ncbi:hypothetical protein AB0A76_05440 [Streptomyces exfoliatus]|uniref:Uncharacterized protein n=1 Tax=Streptomyces exfoliatus TaxID=1905 RepID=A0ABV3CR17_STREX
MTITVDIRKDHPRRRVLGRVLLAGGVTAGVACAVGPEVAESTRLLVLTTPFEYRWPSFLAAVVLLGTAVWLLTDRTAIRVPTLTACVVAACGALAFGLLFFPLFGGGWEETGRKAAPGGAERYLVVEEGAAMIDPLWRVSVVDGSGLGAHHWPAGFFNGDAADHALLDVSWAGPDALRFTTVDGTVTTVRLDPGTGKPERKLSVP